MKNCIRFAILVLVLAVCTSTASAVCTSSPPAKPCKLEGEGYLVSLQKKETLVEDHTWSSYRGGLNLTFHDVKRTDKSGVVFFVSRIDENKKAFTLYNAHPATFSTTCGPDRDVEVFVYSAMISQTLPETDNDFYQSISVPKHPGLQVIVGRAAMGELNDKLQRPVRILENKDEFAQLFLGLVCTISYPSAD